MEPLTYVSYELLESIDTLPDGHPLRTMDPKTIQLMKAALYRDPTVTESTYTRFMPTPLVELLSVSIFPDDDEGEPSQVYGTIQVIDGKGHTFNLYSRDEDDEEHVVKGGHLTLTLPKGRAISALYQVELKIDIKDKTRKADLANGLLSLDYSIREDYDQVQTECIYGKCGHAVVQYITYRHAVRATVDVHLLKGCFGDDDSDCTSTDVYGKIVASCGDNCSSILFERTQDQSVRVEYGACMDLCRHVVAVPAHSTIVIAVDLWNRDTQKHICCKDTITPLGFPEEPNELIQVEMHWDDLYYVPRAKVMTRLIEGASSKEKLDRKKPRLISCNQHSSSSYGVDRDVMQLSKAMENLSTKLLGSLVLEVFSVVIVSDNGEGVDLWGTIKVCRILRDEHLLFGKEKQDAVKLLSNQAAPIRAPDHSLEDGSSFRMKLNLKDAEDRAISTGMVRWEKVELERMFWYNRPHCSVVRGDIGYAALHYAVFSHGIQATIKVFFDSESKTWANNCFRVHGSVLTEYSTKKFKYVTPYERKHYRNELFHKYADNPQLLSPGFEVPLSKYVVGVPLNSALIVDLDLTITPPQTQAAETFQGRLYFTTPDCEYTERQRIRGNCEHDISVSVSWSEAPWEENAC